eukprot:317169_1
MQYDGNYVFRRKNIISIEPVMIPVWSTQTSGEEAKYVEITSDGNIMLIGNKKEDTHHIFWQSETGNHEQTMPHRLVVRDDSFYLMDVNPDIIWSPDSSCQNRESRNQLLIAQPLYVMIPMYGSYKLCGNDVVYSDWHEWDTHRAQGGTNLFMQPNGELVLLTDGTAIWNTNTANSGATYAEIRSDGNIVVKDYNNVTYFALNTGNVTNMKYQLQLGVVHNCVYLRNNDLNELIWSQKAQGSECVIPWTHNTTMLPQTPTAASYHPTNDPFVSYAPTNYPSRSPTDNPSVSPTNYTSISHAPTSYITSTNPSVSPVQSISAGPTKHPSTSPLFNPKTSIENTVAPTQNMITTHSETPMSSFQNTNETMVWVTRRQDDLTVWIVLFCIMGSFVGCIVCICAIMWLKTGRGSSKKYMIDVYNMSFKRRPRPVQMDIHLE